jgi:hypothetical protein
MAVDHYAAMILRVGQEWLADPAQVVGVLLLDGDAGADFGMDEEIVAEPDVSSKLFRNPTCAGGIAAPSISAIRGSSIASSAAAEAP